MDIKLHKKFAKETRICDGNHATHSSISNNEIKYPLGASTIDTYHCQHRDDVYGRFDSRHNSLTKTPCGKNKASPLENSSVMDWMDYCRSPRKTTQSSELSY